MTKTLKKMIIEIIIKKIVFLLPFFGFTMWDVPYLASAKGNNPMNVPIEK